MSIEKGKYTLCYFFERVNFTFNIIKKGKYIPFNKGEILPLYMIFLPLTSIAEYLYTQFNTKYTIQYNY